MVEKYDKMDSLVPIFDRGIFGKFSKLRICGFLS